MHLHPSAHDQTSERTSAPTQSSPDAEASAERLRDVAESLTPLRATGRVLGAQLGSVVDFTDSAAHDLVARLSAISQEMHAVVATVTKAWKEDTAAFVSEVKRSAREREEALRALRAFMSSREQSVETDGERWSALLRDTDVMQGNVEEIRALAVTARILTFNARIEASHAGERGAAFACVANEMRELTEGIDQIAKRVGGRVESMGAQIRTDYVLEAERAIVAERTMVDELGRRLDGLGAFDALQRSTEGLLARLASSTERIAAQVSEALASVQFQDISRQKIEQVTKALEGFDAHIGRVVEFAASTSGELDAESIDASSLLSGYVMHSQRHIHARVTGGAAPGDATSSADDDDQGPAIELF